MNGSGNVAERKGKPSHDFLLLLILFVAFRLGTVFFFRPGGYIRDYSDLIYYQSRASWQDFGFLPYRDYWSDYPPLFAWLTVGIDRIARLIPAWEDQRLWFAVIFGLLTVAAESLTLVALYRLARRIHGDGALRVVWLYAGSVSAGVSAWGMVRRPAGGYDHGRAGVSGERIRLLGRYWPGY